MQYLTKEQIITATEKIFSSFTHCCEGMDERQLFESPAPGKWSAAEHIRHLVISTNTSRLAYTLPSFIVRWIGGTPNRGSRSYEALVERYKEKLAAGGRASGRFVPKPINKQYGKRKIISDWLTATEKFLKAIKNNCSESKLDDYLVRHPLLGRITLRELCYFTIYHTAHHLNIILQNNTRQTN